MSHNLKNFRDWYVDALKELHKKRAGGLAAIMISFPLLERYLRQKIGLRPDQPVDNRCMGVLRAIFDALPSEATARDFWNVYRNGFLHQATLSLQTGAGRSLPGASLTHDITVPVAIESNGNFVLNPKLFSEAVVRTIENDFAVFEGIGGHSSPLPHVVGIVSPATGLIVPPITLSTRS